MHAALVTDLTRPPVYGEHADPQAGPATTVVEVEASAVHRVVRSIASGAHYSAGDALPFIPGVDGVARLADGTRVYTGGTDEPFGMLAERAPVPAGWAIPVPDAVDSALAAAIVNPAASGWLPLSRLLPAGGTVLVLGATGVSGGLAVRAARLLGAGRVVAAGRNRARLDELDADAVLPLDAADPAAALRAAADAYDVVVDYTWGPVSAALLHALATTRPDPDRPVEWVQIGSTAGEEIALPSAVLRRAPIRLSGSGLGAISPRQLFATVGDVLAATARGDLTLEIDVHPLSEVEAAWELPGRLVFRP